MTPASACAALTSSARLACRSSLATKATRTNVRMTRGRAMTSAALLRRQTRERDDDLVSEALALLAFAGIERFPMASFQDALSSTACILELRSAARSIGVTVTLWDAAAK